MVVAFETDRLRLRPLAQCDWKLYCSLYTDATVMRHVGPLSTETAQETFHTVLRQMAATPARSRYWVLLPRDPGEELGLLALVPDRDDDTRAEVGILLRPGAQGCGYAAEAIAALADRAFAQLQELWARHAPDNARMAAVMRRLHFERIADVASRPSQLRWRLRRETWLAGGRQKPFLHPPAPGARFRTDSSG